jgi:hypothetical protein
MWWTAWKKDENPPRRLIAEAQNSEEAWAQITQKGLLLGKVEQKIYGPYDSKTTAEIANIPSPKTNW